MDKSSRRRLQFTMLAILVCAVFCLGPMLRDLGGRNSPDPKQLAARESNRQGHEAMNQRNWPLAITRFDEAIRSYEELMEQISDKPTARGPFVNRRFHFDAVNRQIDDLGTMIDLKSEITDVQFNRGIAYKEVGEYLKAIDDFSAVIKWKSLPKAYELRAETYRALGKNTAPDKDDEMVTMLRAANSQSNK